MPSRGEFPAAPGRDQTREGRSYPGPDRSGQEIPPISTPVGQRPLYQFDSCGTSSRTRCPRPCGRRTFSFSRLHTRFSACRCWKPWTRGCRWWRHESHSLPEVAGDAACYFDPLDIADMAAQIRKVARCSSTTRPASRGLTSSDDCLRPPPRRHPRPHPVPRRHLRDRTQRSGRRPHLARARIALPLATTWRWPPPPSREGDLGDPEVIAWHGSPPMGESARVPRFAGGTAIRDRARHHMPRVKAPLRRPEPIKLDRYPPLKLDN